MPAGRIPLPDEEKKRKGTFKPSRSTGKEVGSVGVVKVKRKRGRPKKVVSGANLSEEARKMYDQGVQIMQEFKILSEYDYHMIAIMCNEYDTYIALKDMPKIEYNSETGMSMVHASVRVRKIALDNFMKIATALSLTAVMRMRIRVKEDDGDGDDPMRGML